MAPQNGKAAAFTVRGAGNTNNRSYRHFTNKLLKERVAPVGGVGLFAR